MLSQSRCYRADSPVAGFDEILSAALKAARPEDGRGVLSLSPSASVALVAASMAAGAITRGDWDEAAAIAEFEGGASRSVAEATVKAIFGPKPTWSPEEMVNAPWLAAIEGRKT